jgi:hypothetical protein
LLLPSHLVRYHQISTAAAAIVGHCQQLINDQLILVPVDLQHNLLHWIPTRFMVTQ